MSRGRPKVANGTLVTDRGVPLRGGVAEVFAWGKQIGKTAYVSDPRYYRKLRRARLNAIRVVCSDAWQRTNNFPHWDISKESDRGKFLSELDAIVELAS